MAVSMREKRRRKSGELILTFTITFFLTLVIGFMCIFFLGNQKEEITVIDFLMKEKESIVQNFTTEKTIIEENVEQEEDGWRVNCAQDGNTTLLFAGDILLDDSYAVMSNFKLKGSLLENAFSNNLLDEMKSADIFMANNEFTFSDRGEPTPGKTFTFRADPQDVNLLQNIGVDIVSLANNHAYDYGEISLLDTLDTLNGAGIYYVGAGRNIEEASNIVYAKSGNRTIAYVSATQIERNPTPDTKGATEERPGVFRCNNPELLISKIQEAKENSDFVVLYIHWGTESTTVLDDLQKKQADLYTKAGADLIIGDHAHCLQQLGYVNNVPVIFSMANFWFNSKTQDTCLIKVVLDENNEMQWQILPCKQSGCRTELLEGSEKERVLSYMRSISPGVIITPMGYITPAE